MKMIPNPLGDHIKAGPYIPISLRPALFKLFERLMTLGLTLIFDKT